MEKQLEGLESLSINVEELYKEESITDRKLLHQKVDSNNKDGSEDPTRETIYIRYNFDDPNGTHTRTIPLEASSLEAAFELFLRVLRRLWKN